MNDTTTISTPTGETCLGEARLHAFLQGELDPAEALFVATHCHLSVEARKRLIDLAMSEAAEMEQVEPQKMRCSAQAFFEEKCRDSRHEEIVKVETKNEGECCGKKCVVPKPLQPLIGDDFKALVWRATDVDGIQEADVPVPDSRATVKLVKICKGTIIPEHAHIDDEMILILHGHTANGDVELRTGDVGVFFAEPDRICHPVCLENTLLLWVSMGKTRFTGLLAKILAPFAR